MVVMKCECECIENMEYVELYRLFLVETNTWYYLAAPNNGWLNQQSNETYDLKLTNSKILMPRTLIINCMSMHCSIKMYNLKQLCWFKWKTWLKSIKTPLVSTTNNVTSN